MSDYYKKYQKYKEKYLKLQNGDYAGIYYEIKGTYNDCSIVLFANSTLYSWNHTENKHYNFLKKLSDLTTTFAYDLPESAASKTIDKHQKSSVYPFKKDMNFESHVKIIYNLLKKNNVKPPYVLIGHSLGAFNALVFATLYPNEVNTVILLDGTRHCQKMYESTKQGAINATFINANDTDMQEIVRQFMNVSTGSQDDEIELAFTINNDVTIEKVKSWKKIPKTEIVKKFNKGKNVLKDKQIEILLAINNTSWIEKIKYWYQVPDKLNNIKIVGLWNIWIVSDAKYGQQQIEFLETMKEYHEILKKENKDNYDSYFFFGQSHFLHHSNTNEVIDIIKKYL